MAGRLRRFRTRMGPKGWRVTDRSPLRGPLAGALLSGCIAAGWSPLPDAQGLGRIIGGAVGRPIVGSVARTSSDQRFRVVRSTLSITRDRAGAVTRLYSDRGRSLLFVILGDGSARLWDLTRGVQVGGALGNDIVAGAIRGTGKAVEIVAIRNDGSSLVLRPDGTRSPLGGRIEGLDASVPPVVSSDGRVMAFRTVDGWWYARRESGQWIRLPDAASAALPALSPNGSRIVYRTVEGATMIANLSERTVSLLGSLGGCARGVRTTASAFASGGERVVFGDAAGNLCVWVLAGGADPLGPFIVRAALPGPIETLVTNRDGSRAAVADTLGTVGIWTVAGRTIREVGSLKLDAGASHTLILDSRRRWVLSGEGSGTVGIHALHKRHRIARLISTTGGWTVLDREGRFDGSQSGIDALDRVGETDDETKQHILPVDAFSESYYEPGLLAKLDHPAPALLNEDVPNLSEAGYVRPPRVTIEPIDVGGRDVGEHLPITVQVEPGYPRQHVTGIRLYHNGKLADQASGGDGIARFMTVLSPGRNTFRAIGVGPGGVEGRPVEQVVRMDEAPSLPEMHVVAIGINDYVRPDWTLLYARNDAQSIVSTLRDQGGRLRGRSAGSSYRDVRDATLLDKSARKPTIEERILGQSSSPHDVLVVYFSGHGYALQGEQRWEWYLLPFTDEWRHKASSQDELDRMIREHGVSSRRLMALLTQAKARQVFLILDSCQSGAVAEAVEALADSDPRVTGDAVTQKALRHIARVGGIHVLAASRAQEDAQELELEPHGALTYLVLEGMRGAADGDGNRTVSVSELIEYATREMPHLARRLAQEPISQKPVGYSRGTDFALAGL